MKWKETLRKGLEAGKMFTEKVKGSPYAEILRSNVSRDLITRGELMIPEAVLERKIAESLARQTDAVKLESLSCREDRIHLELRITKLRVRSAVSMDIFIQKIEVGPDRQIAVCRIGGEKMAGSNLIGKIVVAMIQSVVSDVLKTAVSRADIADRVLFSEDDRLVTVDLSRLEPVQKLLSPIPLTGIAAIDLVSFHAFHRTGGLTIKAVFADTGRNLKQGMAHLASTAHDAVLRKRESGR